MALILSSDEWKPWAERKAESSPSGNAFFLAGAMLSAYRTHVSLVSRRRQRWQCSATLGKDVVVAGLLRNAKLLLATARNIPKRKQEQ